MSLLHQSFKWAAELSFPGKHAPGAEVIAERLRRGGCGDKRVAVRKDDETGWRVVFAHPHWGKGAARYKPGAEPVDADAMRLQPGLLEADIAAHGAAGCCIEIRGEGSNGHLLRDRKGMLWFARTILGNDGIDALDIAAMQFWTKEMLDDELCHDADADINAVHLVHGVQNDDGSVWAHTHGLAPLGGPDIDLLRPDIGMMELLRSVVFRVLEGEVPVEEPSFMQVGPSHVVVAVPVEHFHALGRREDIMLRSDDEFHNSARVVLCDPPGRIDRVLKRKLRPSSVFTGKRPVAAMPLTEQASDIISDRAKAALPMLRRMREEFAGYDSIVGLKMGIPTDDGESREHMWFELHELGAETARAMLMNRPFQVSTMTQGETYEIELTKLSDWIMQTPAGPISPSSTAPARMLRRGMVG